ncbi:MAG TPA: DUF5777 family beta-barrel protein [Catalimonadaceae bacterium]|nr:DUF5777 family beta-barrel protein [Catalimonadaceae bacterium]
MTFKHIIAICFTVLTSQAYAQDDLLNMMDSAPSKPEPVKATFKTTRVLNGHSIEQVASRHLDFRINHRFGLLNSGYDQFYGLDYARIRLSLEYGINDWAMIGIGRNNLGRKAWDYFAKFRVLRQTKDNSIPLSVSLLGTAAVDITKIANSTSHTDRTTYTSQILLARKFTEGISIQLTPTYIHRNQVETPDLNNDVFALGIGGRFKISRRTSFNVEYFYVMDPKKVTNDKLQNSLSVGFDIETGGHVFQLHFTNSLGLIEKDFIAGTTNRWDKGQIGYGFNISRTFSFR